MKKYAALLSLVLWMACNDNKSPDTIPTEVPANNTNTSGIAAPVALQASLMAEYPHDTNAFTEGLFVYNGKMYEGTGMEKNSFIQITDIKTGKAEKKYPVKDETIFGEGINIIGDKLYQLTYRNHVVLVYNLDNLSKPVKTFPWQGEGWGMTNNGKELIISDGQPSGNLYFVNPADFKINRIIQVTDNTGTLDSVNELEYIDGYIYANVWGSTYIIKIDPANGHVVGKLETGDLLKSFYSTYTIRQMENVLNGIAYDSTSKKIYITGKNWPKVFEIRLN